MSEVGIMEDEEAMPVRERTSSAKGFLNFGLDDFFERNPVELSSHVVGQAQMRDKTIA